MRLQQFIIQEGNRIDTISLEKVKEMLKTRCSNAYKAFLKSNAIYRGRV